MFMAAKADWFETYEPRAIDAVIEVDGVIPGCPIDGYEFRRVVTTALTGSYTLKPLIIPFVLSANWTRTFVCTNADRCA